MNDKIRINNNIRSPSLRVITEEGENLGVLSLGEALKVAQERGLDLIEISPGATPPIAKVMDFGKFQYQSKKKHKAAKARTTETKSLQIKIGTGDHDLEIKARRASEFLAEGHRVKMELFLRGRAKYFDQKFLAERLARVLKFISVPYRTTGEPERSPKGLVVIIERDKNANKNQQSGEETPEGNQER